MAEPLDLNRRAPVWEALAELFVGRELQDYDYAAFAQILRASSYGIDELERILRDEVAPVYRQNLTLFAIPEMQGWTHQQVVAQVQANLDASQGKLRQLLKRLRPHALPHPVAGRWNKLAQMIC
jgi:hypothetical protein